MMTKKKKLQNIRVLDCIPMGVFYELPGHSIPDGYFCSEPGQEEFADRSQELLEKMLTKAGWKLERHEVDISLKKLEAIFPSKPHEVLKILEENFDTPGVVIAKHERNVICTAAWRYSDAVRKAAARAQKVRLL